MSVVVRVVPLGQSLAASYVFGAYALALRLALRCSSARSMRLDMAFILPSVIALALVDFCPLVLLKVLLECSRR